MRLKKQDKVNLVDEMAKRLESAKTVVLVNYRGLTVAQTHRLKKKLHEFGIEFHVTKSTLFNLALKAQKIEADEEVLKQPIGLIWGLEDEVVPAKITSQVAKDLEKLEIVGGIVNGQFASADLVKQLAALPGREELYAKLVGTLNAPMYRLVNALQGNLRSLVYILDQYGKQKA